MKNRGAILVLFLLVAACTTFGQQSGTTTECEKVLDKMTCKTTPTPPTPSGLGEIFRPKKEKDTDQPQTVVAAAPSGLSPEAVKAYLAEEKAMQDAKDTVDFIYCRQNPKSNVTDNEKQKACADVIEYTKAFCSVNPTEDRCTLARSREEVQKAFAPFVNQYNSDPHRSRPYEQSYYSERFAKLIKWGCMSFPDMVLPEKEGTYACPNAPEPTQTK